MMKQAVFAGCLAVMMMLSLSVLILEPGTIAGREPTSVANAASHERETLSEEKPQNELQQDMPSYDGTVGISLLIGDRTVEMTLHDYLKGVVLAEMPASFEVAALEAQAIAARTFAVRQKQHPKHALADVCADGTCCQQYIAPELACEKLGDSYAEYEEKIDMVVRNTDGKVIKYEGELIEAVYFSCSGGTTEAAVAVWGSDVPYLQSVESPGEESSGRYQEVVAVEAAQFRRIIQESSAVRLDGAPLEWIGDTSYSEGGGVLEIEIGGAVFSGAEIRKLFGLRSTCFTVQLENDCFLFETKGYGHRVGMSQYGAQAMAVQGASCYEILAHYYTGIEVTDAAP